MNERLVKIKQQDSTVHRVLDSDGSELDCMEALFNEKQFFIKRLIALESIAPRKFQLPNGDVMVWHCPDSLIPTTEIKP